MDETPKQKLGAIVGGLALVVGAVVVANHFGNRVNDVVRKGQLVPAHVTNVSTLCRYGLKTVAFTYELAGVKREGSSQVPCDYAVPGETEAAVVASDPTQAVLMYPARYEIRKQP